MHIHSRSTPILKDLVKKMDIYLSQYRKIYNTPREYTMLNNYLYKTHYKYPLKNWEYILISNYKK